MSGTGWQEGGGPEPSDIQRYAFDSFGPGHPGGVIIHSDDGVYVLHEDMVAALAAQATAHEAALAEAVERHERAIGNTSVAAFREGYETGIAESLPIDTIAEGVRLLQTIGLDITYTDEGLEVIVRQIVRQGVVSERARIRAGVEALRPDEPWGGPTTTTGSFYVRKAAVLAVIDGGEGE